MLARFKVFAPLALADPTHMPKFETAKANGSFTLNVSHNGKRKKGERSQMTKRPRTTSKAWLTATLMACLLFISMAQPPEESDLDLNSPGKEHTILNALAGSWDVTLKIPIGENKFVDGKSRCEAQWVMDGRFLRQEYTSTFRGKPLTVVRYLGYDRHKGKFVEVHFESTHTDVMYSEGSLSEDRTTISCRGTHVDVATNQRVEVRTVTTMLPDDTFTLAMTYADQSGRDSKTVTLTHTRRQ
jgi:hypothetical protein